MEARLPPPPNKVWRGNKCEWSREFRQQVVDAYNVSKVSTAKLAIEFGVTKNTLIGIINRAKQKVIVAERGPDFGKKGQTKEKKNKVVVQRSKVRKPSYREPEEMRRMRLRLLTDPRCVTFEQLEPHMCRFPLGDPRHEEFRFCGADHVPDAPYCPDHCLLAYQQPKPRERP